MEPRDDDINEFLIRKTDDKEEKFFSKFSLLKHGDMQYTKEHIKNVRRDNSFVTKFIYYTDIDNEKATTFFDAFVMTYFSNISKRDKDSLGIDELFDRYGNRIKIYATDKLTLCITGKVIPEEVEHLYDRLIFEVIEKVRTYGEDMEIGR